MLLILIFISWLLITVFRLFLYKQHIIYYGLGMVTYRVNNKSRYEAWSMAMATYDEFIELIEAIIAREWYEAIAEMCDVIHGIVNTVALFMLGSLMKKTSVYWIIYILCPLTAWKHGDRYLRYGCTRSINHHSEDGDGIGHICSGNKEKIANNKYGLANI